MNRVTVPARVRQSPHIARAAVWAVLCTSTVCLVACDAPSSQPTTSEQTATVSTEAAQTPKRLKEEARQQAKEAKQQAARKAHELRLERQSQGLAWNYTREADEMGRGIVRRAFVSSLNEVEFEAPYEGSQRATLTFRIHPKYGNDVILTIERGQFLCGIEGCNVVVRFNSAHAQAFHADGPEDGNTTSLFIRGYDRFLSRARRSKRVRIEATFFQEGTRVFEFDCSGLRF